MNPTSEVVTQDIKTALAYFKNKNFDYVGRIGNRVMTNLVLGGEKDLIFMGYFFKEIASDYGVINNNYVDRIDDCMDIGDKFIQNILDDFSDNNKFDPVELWKYFFEYEKEIRKFIPTNTELTSYEENVEFTKQGVNLLINHLEENKYLLLQEENGILIGVINEISRLINTHGFEETELTIYLSLKAFLEYYAFIYRIKIVDEEYMELEEELKELIYPYLDKILNYPKELNELYTYFNDFMSDMGYQTRILFINYQEPRRQSNENRKEKQFKMPKESKEEIGKMIKTAIEKEVK